MQPPDDPSSAEQPSSRTFTRAALIVAALTVVISIGTPLIGLRVFHATDELKRFAPWSATAEAGFQPANGRVTDTVNSVMPLISDYRRGIRSGQFPLWSPYPAGGTALGAVPDLGGFSPFTLPYLALPLWYAPAIVKLLEMIAAIAGTYFLLRRLRLGKVPAIAGGLIYAFSGFEVVWTNWPQAAVAATIPILFWAVERTIQERTARSASIVAIATAVMLFEGFPAVTEHAVIAVAVYTLVRVLASHGTMRERAQLLALVGGAVVVGIGLSAIQLLPFERRLQVLNLGYREHWEGIHLPFESLVTLLIPNAFGSNPQLVKTGFDNYVEMQSFIGVTASLLIGVAAFRGSGKRQPRGAVPFFWAASAIAVLAIYIGGPVLHALQLIPFMGTSKIGRMRALLGLLLAVLAAVGLDSLTKEARASRTRRTAFTVVVGAGALALAVAIVPIAHLVDKKGKLHEAIGASIVPVVIAVLAVTVVVLALRRRSWGVPLALIAFPILIAVESAAFAIPFWPRLPRSEFYPVTATHRFIEQNIGDDTIASGLRVLEPGTNILYGFRSVTAHVFIEPAWGDLLKAMDPAVLAHPTFPMLSHSQRVAASPVLDRLGARFFVAQPDRAVFGRAVPPPAAGAVTTLGSNGSPPSGDLSAPSLRAITISVDDARKVGTLASVRADVRDEKGTLVTTGTRRILPDARGAFSIPVVEVRGARNMKVQISLIGGGTLSLRSAQPSGSPSLGYVAGERDGLKIVFVDGSVIYRRLDALPRIRWATSTEIIPDARERLAALVRGVPPDTVVLNGPAPATSGRPATFSIQDGRDVETIRARAAGAGYVVIADALQYGWNATIDGRSTDLLRADHAGVAVYVPQGDHTIALHYRPAGLRAGRALTGVSLLFLIGSVVVRPRRRMIAAA